MGMQKKQTAVSHSSTEAEVISYDTGLRMEGLPALTLWDHVIDVLEPPANRATRDPSRQLKPKTSQTTQETIDHVPPNAQESSNRARLFLFEDNEAVIKMISKVRSPHMRHVSRTHRVNLGWLCHRIKLNSNSSVKYVHTNQLIGDILTKRFILTSQILA